VFPQKPGSRARPGFCYPIQLCKEVSSMYEAPEIVYEGDLEIQAGSPLGSFDVPEDWDF